MKRYLILAMLGLSACTPAPEPTTKLNGIERIRAFEQQKDRMDIRLAGEYRQTARLKPARSSHSWICYTGPRGGRYHYSASGNKVYSGC